MTGKRLANGLLIVGLLVYVVAFFLPVTIKPDGAIYILLKSFRIMNMSQEDEAIRILAGIFIWFPTLSVLFIVLSRMRSFRKWFVVLLMSIGLFVGGFIAYESQTDFKLFHFPPTMGTGFWVWLVALVTIHFSQVVYWFSKK